MGGGWWPGGIMLSHWRGLGSSPVWNSSKKEGASANWERNCGGDFGADFVAAGADAGADSGDEVLGIGAEVHLHLADGFDGDPGEGAAPAGVDGGEARFLGSTRRTGTQSAVWMARRRSGRVGGAGVASAGMRVVFLACSKMRTTSEWNCFRVTRVDLRRRGGLEAAAIFLDAFAGVPVGGAEV